MKIKILIALAAIVTAQVLLPSFESTNLKATLVNMSGKSVSCEFSWSGVGFGTNLSDSKYDECINSYVEEGYSISSNERSVEQKTLLAWLMFG